MTLEDLLVAGVIFAISAAAYLTGIVVGWRWKAESDRPAFDCGYDEGWRDCCHIHDIKEPPRLRVIDGGRKDPAA